MIGNNLTRLILTPAICDDHTDGVHCRRKAVGAGPVVLKVVPVTGVAFSGITTMDQFVVRLTFPTPTIGTYSEDMKY